MDSWTASGWGPVTIQCRHPHPPGSGAGDWATNWSCLCDEGSISVPIVGGLESFRVAKRFHVPAGRLTPTLQGQGILLLGPLQTAPHTSSLGIIYILYNKPINISKVFLWVLWSIIANYWTEEGVVGTLDWQPSQTKVWVTWGPTICSWHLMSGQSCGTAPLTCGVCSNSG